MMTLKEKVHRLVDELPEAEMPEVARYLEHLRKKSDPLQRALREAPEDDEPITEEEAQAIEEGERDLEEGRIVTSARARVHLGL
jgi:predicted transcriptional regulator